LRPALVLRPFGAALLFAIERRPCLTLSLRLAHLRPRLAVLGAGLLVAGGFGVSGLVGIDLVVWQMAQRHADTTDMLALLKAVSSELGVVLPLYGPTGTLGLGFALLLGGWNTRGPIPRGSVAIMVAGVALWAAGLRVAPLGIAGTVLLLVGLARAGLTLDPRTELKLALIGGCSRSVIPQQSIEGVRPRRSGPSARAPLRGSG
jgi:hypothetical protein